MACDVCSEKHEEDPVDCKCACHQQKPKLKTMRDFEMYQMFGSPQPWNVKMELESMVIQAYHTVY